MFHQDLPFDYRMTYPSVDSKIIISQSVSRSTDIHESAGITATSMGTSYSASFDLSSPHDPSPPPQPLTLSQRLQLIEVKQRRCKFEHIFSYLSHHHYHY